MILLVGDVFQPVNDLAVELFLNGDVCHTRFWRGSVPVLFTGRKPDDIAWANLLDWATCALHPSTARCNDESLSKRMCVPRSSRTRFEGHDGALNKRRIRRLQEGMDA